jgi:hypothetical protein
VGEEQPFLDYLDANNIGLASASNWTKERRIYFDPALLYFYYQEPKPWEVDWLVEHGAERERVTAEAKRAGKKVPTIYWTRLVCIPVAEPGQALSVVRGEERRPLIFMCELLTGM